MVAGRQRLAVRFRSTPARRNVAGAPAARVAGVSALSGAVSGVAASGLSGSSPAAGSSAWPSDLLPALPGSPPGFRSSPAAVLPMGGPIPSQGSSAAQLPVYGSSEAPQPASASRSDNPGHVDVAFQPAAADPPAPGLFR